MDDGVRHDLSGRANLEGGDELGDGVAGGPDPEVEGLIAQGGEQFVELKMAEGEVVEEVRVDLVGVLAGACEPKANSCLGGVEE